MSTTKRVLEAKLSEDDSNWIITIEFTHHPGWLRRTFLGAKESKEKIQYIGRCTVWAHYPSFVSIHNYNMEFFLHDVWAKAKYEHEAKEAKNA